MTRTNLVMIMTAIMMTGVAGISFDVLPVADAAKGKGVPLLGVGSNSGICGLMLCSDYPGGKEAYQMQWSSQFITPKGVISESHQDKSEAKSISVSAHNVGEEYPAQLDVFIHKFEMGKISAEDALDGIKEIHSAYVNARITNDIVSGVGDKLNLYNKGTFDAPTAVESIHLTAEPQNVNPEYQGALDEVIHKFEVDKITADQAINGIIEVHDSFTGLYITSNLIEAVDEKITLINSGKLSGADAVEAIHLSAEPQNVDPEFIGALDEYLHKFELNKLPAEETMAGIVDVHEGLTSLYISSDLVETVGVQINIYNSGNDSVEHVLHEIHEAIEEVEDEMAMLHSVDGEMPVKELPPNTVDMPEGAGVPGCEANDMCYYPTNLTVEVGTTVTWINSDGFIPHTVTAGWPDSDSVGTNYPGGFGFDSDFMSGGDIFEHTFTEPGEYDYYCQLHPWMIGSVTVA